MHNARNKAQDSKQDIEPKGTSDANSKKYAQRGKYNSKYYSYDTHDVYFVKRWRKLNNNLQSLIVTRE